MTFEVSAPKRPGPVVAAVEDAHDQQLIVRYAAGEATRGGRALHIVHVADPRHGAEEQRRAAAVTEALTAAAHAEFPGLDIRAEEPTGHAAAVLVDRSASASLLVVGHRGTGGFPRLPLGSVSWQVATHASSPVIVLRPGRTGAVSSERVVAAVEDPEDRSSHSAGHVLAFAARAAAGRGTPLELVHATARPELMNTGPAGPARAAGNRVPHPQQQRALEELAAVLRQRHPGVQISARVLEGRAATVLTEVSESAGLVVVGSHGRSGVRRLMLGSVSAEVLHTASCPVAVIPRPGR